MTYYTYFLFTKTKMSCAETFSQYDDFRGLVALAVQAVLVVSVLLLLYLSLEPATFSLPAILLYMSILG